jgi:hypothetical protein
MAEVPEVIREAVRYAIAKGYHPDDKAGIIARVYAVSEDTVRTCWDEEHRAQSKHVEDQHFPPGREKVTR